MCKTLHLAQLYIVIVTFCNIDLSEFAFTIQFYQIVEILLYHKFG